MAIAIAVRCGNVTNGTGDIRAKIDAIHVDASGMDVYNVDGTQKRYRLRLVPPGGLESATSSGYSHLFTPSAVGEHTWDGYTFPGSGSWGIELYDDGAGVGPALTISGASTVANPTVITTTAAHGLSSGEEVTISGSTGYTPTINGAFQATVISPTTFSIPVNVATAGTGGTILTGGVVATQAVTVV